MVRQVRSRFGLAVALLVVLLMPGGAAPVAAAQSTPEAIPSAVQAVVLRIEYVGGFAPAWAQYTELPLVALYDDGRLVTQGPQIEIYPPPALPNLRQTVLTEKGIEAVLAAAGEAGLIGAERRYDNPMVADAPYTLITVNADGTVGRVAIEALGIERNPEWTPAEQEAVTEIQRFVERMSDVTSWLPPEAIAVDDESYPIDHLQVIADPIIPSPSTPEPSDPAQDQPPVEWPLATPIPVLVHPVDLSGATEALHCGTVSGADAQAVVEVARSANMLTPWLSDGQPFRLTLRPLLPDESGCQPHTPGLDALPAAIATPAA